MKINEWTIAMIKKTCHVAAMLVLTAGFSGWAFAGNCASNGGDATCVAAIPTSDWTYALCDDTGPYTYREVAWCITYGGTWGENGCVGANISVTPANASGLAGTFERLVHGDSTCGGALPAPSCS
ncbi:MAG TPA: hypothetical protein VFJ86_06165, partial [Usitatibacter sp.]|nr:hypothetical protein [Usitatibacter sp.]